MAVLSSHKALVAAALADVKYDKIAVVREVHHVCAGALYPNPGVVWLCASCRAIS